MTMANFRRLFAAAAVFFSIATVTHAEISSHQPRASISFIQIDHDI
ncbi:hypothetical protein ACLMJV_13105 [Sinorhizobium meliloti]|nr:MULTISPECIES: hypothetical protein [Sinorhizobium]